MTVLSAITRTTQLTLDFEPGLVERYPSAMDALRAAVYGSGKPLKVLAADLDMGESTLSRKLRAEPDDPRRFSLDEFDRYLEKTGDLTVLRYLVAKHMRSDEDRKADVLASAEKLLAQLVPALQALKGAA